MNFPKGVRAVPTITAFKAIPPFSYVSNQLTLSIDRAVAHFVIFILHILFALVNLL
ncbi:hypothetical protein BLGI_2412 [Brevibacillus laterosporus GI-9]|nr:hypothetical protein BLGI_2412 [Brevibacillus laterosporus GI-9]